VAAVAEVEVAEVVPAMTEEQIEQTMSAAQDLLMGGQVEQAVDTLLPIVKFKPDHQESNALIGAVLLGLQQYEVAEQFLYAAANASAWTDGPSVANLASVFMQTDAVDLASKTLVKGLEASNNADPSGALSLGMGDLNLANAQYSQAADWYLASALKRPARIDVWVKASTLRFPESGRDLKFAENVLMQGLASNRNSAVLVFHMGLCMQLAGRMPEAITFYEESVRMDSSGENAEAVAALATALHSEGRLQEALPLYQSAMQLPPNVENVVLLSNFAMCLNALGSKGEGLQLAMRAVDLDSNSADAIRAMKECS
jgi:tetratricopeptide (TPR) repeat protein